MASGLLGRIERLEARGARPQRVKSADPEVLLERLEVAIRSRDAEAALPTDQRIEAKLRELEALEAYRAADHEAPWSIDRLHRFRVRLVEIDLEELRGTDARECALEKMQANLDFSGVPARAGSRSHEHEANPARGLARLLEVVREVEDRLASDPFAEDVLEVSGNPVPDEPKVPARASEYDRLADYRARPPRFIEP